MEASQIAAVVFSAVADVATVTMMIVAIVTLRKNKTQVMIDRLFELMKQQQFCDILSILHDDTSEDGSVSLLQILQQEKVICLDNFFWAIDAILKEFPNSKEVCYFFENPVIRVIKGKKKIEQLIEYEFATYNRFEMLHLALTKQEDNQ